MRIRTGSIMPWALAGTLTALAAQGETLFEEDGITLAGTARIVSPDAAFCQVLEEHNSAEEYERMKAYHGQPLNVWRIDFSARNGSDRPLSYLRAIINIGSARPPCSSWTAPVGSYAQPVQWSSSFQVVEKPDGMEPGEQVGNSVFLLAFHDQRPGFESWNVDYQFSEKAVENEGTAGGHSPFIVVAVPAQANVTLLSTRQPYRRRMLLEPGRYLVEVSSPGYRTRRVWLEHKYTWPHRIELDLLRGREGESTDSVPDAASVSRMPPGIAVDRLLIGAEQAIQDEDMATAGTTMQRVIALQQQHGLEPAPEDHFRYARIWEAAGALERAMESALRYLELRGREADHYTEALELINRTEAGITRGRTARTTSRAVPDVRNPVIRADSVNEGMVAGEVRVFDWYGVREGSSRGVPDGFVQFRGESRRGKLDSSPDQQCL